MASHWVSLIDGGCRDSLAVKSAFCFSRGLEFSLQHPCQVAHNCFLGPLNPHSRHTQSHIIKNKNLENYWQVLSLMEFELFTVKWNDLTLIPLGLRLSNPHSHWLLPAWDSGMCQEACTAKPGSFVACYFTTLKIKVFKWFPTWNLVEVNSE